MLCLALASQVRFLMDHSLLLGLVKTPISLYHAAEADVICRYSSPCRGFLSFDTRFFGLWEYTSFYKIPQASEVDKPASDFRSRDIPLYSLLLLALKVMRLDLIHYLTRIYPVDKIRRLRKMNSSRRSWIRNLAFDRVISNDRLCRTSVKAVRGRL